MQHREVVDVAERPDAKTRQGRLRDPGQAEVHEAGGQTGHRHGHEREPDHPHDEAEVDPTAFDQASVEHLLDGDRDDHPPGGGHQSERNRERQTLGQLGRQCQPAPHRLHGPGPGAIVPLDLFDRRRHEPLSPS